MPFTAALPFDIVGDVLEVLSRGPCRPPYAGGQGDPRPRGPTELMRHEGTAGPGDVVVTEGQQALTLILHVCDPGDRSWRGLYVGALSAFRSTVDVRTCH